MSFKDSEHLGPRKLSFIERSPLFPLSSSTVLHVQEVGARQDQVSASHPVHWYQHLCREELETGEQDQPSAGELGGMYCCKHFQFLKDFILRDLILRLTTFPIFETYNKFLWPLNSYTNSPQITSI